MIKWDMVFQRFIFVFMFVFVLAGAGMFTKAGHAYEQPSELDVYLSSIGAQGTAVDGLSDRNSGLFLQAARPVLSAVSRATGKDKAQFARMSGIFTDLMITSIEGFSDFPDSYLCPGNNGKIEDIGALAQDFFIQNVKAEEDYIRRLILAGKQTRDDARVKLAVGKLFTKISNDSLVQAIQQKCWEAREKRR